MPAVAKALATIFRPLAKMNSLLADESEVLGGDVLVAASCLEVEGVFSSSLSGVATRTTRRTHTGEVSLGIDMV